MTRTAVYRHYDADGRLLYVGISLNPHKRLLQHNCTSEWAQLIWRTETQWYATRAEAVAAEAEAIANLSPAHNRISPIVADAGSVTDFVRTVGAADLARELRLSIRSVRAAVTRRKFPARWGLIIATICRDRGLHCRMDSFKWAGKRRADCRCIADVMLGHKGHVA